ncbi:kinase-like protein [Trametes sanguinea]|nr:kinase-like protein [Trametes sanguinea]
MASLHRQRPLRNTAPYARDSGFSSATSSSTQLRPLPVIPSNPSGKGKQDAALNAPLEPGKVATPNGPDPTTTGSRPQPLALSDIEATRTIGVGGWGAVHVARVRRSSSSHPLEQSGATFALKVVGKHILRDLERNDRSSDREHASSRKTIEKRILSSLPWNPFIAGLVDSHIDDRNIYLTLEVGQCGTLLSPINNYPGLSDQEIRFYFANIVLALEFLHTQGVVHSDVKPENLVMGADGYLMLTDFGLAQPLHGSSKWTKMGTLEFMSPEIISDEPMDTEEKRLAADWWAAAIVLFEMKNRKLPFECDDPYELIERYATEPFTWQPGVDVCEDFQDLISRMLHVELQHRFGARDIRQGAGGAFINRDVRTHPFMKSVNWNRIAKKLAVAPRVPSALPDMSKQRHRRPFLDPAKVPSLRVKRPSPRLEHLDLTLQEEACPRKKRRMAGELSVCLRPSEQSVTALRGSVDRADA